MQQATSRAHFAAYEPVGQPPTLDATTCVLDQTLESCCRGVDLHTAQHDAAAEAELSAHGAEHLDEDRIGPDVGSGAK